MPFETNDTDIELYILGEVPQYIIEVYIPGDRKYSIGLDKVESISQIRRQLDKEHGVSKVGDVTISLRNDDNQYSRYNSGSIFYNQQVVKCWVRIKSGWGVDWANDIETQFQGKIKRLEQNSEWRARMIVYDVMQDLKDTSVETTPLTIGPDQVSSQNPIDIIEYLIDTHFQLTWFNMDSLLSESLLDATALAVAKEATEGMMIGETIWPVGAKLFDMVADMMKMIGGYVYTSKEGKLMLYVYGPSGDADSARGLYSFVGDVTQKEPEILISKLDQDVDNIINVVNWTYGQNDAKHTSPPDEDSQELYGVCPLDLSTGWELYNDETWFLDSIAARLYSRFALEVDAYELSISWLRNGDGLALDLSNIIDITDPAINAANEYVECHRLVVSLDTQVTSAACYDASALQGKFAMFSSEVDERDGNGITAGNFPVNWLKRFGFFGMPATHFNPAFDTDGNNNGRVNPTYPPIDDWGNGIEESFIFW